MDRLVKFLANGDYSKLLAVLDKSTSNNHSVTASTLLIKTLIRLGKYKICKETLDSYITNALDNKDFNKLRTLFILYSHFELERGQIDSAQNYLEKVANDIDKLNTGQAIDYYSALVKLNVMYAREAFDSNTTPPAVPTHIQSDELKRFNEFCHIYLTYMKSENIHFESISGKLNRLIKLTRDIDQKILMLYSLSNLLYQNNEFTSAHSYITKAADCINHVLSRLSLEDSFYYINSPKSYRVMILLTHVQLCLNSNDITYSDLLSRAASLHDLIKNHYGQTVAKQSIDPISSKVVAPGRHETPDLLPFKSPSMREISDRLKSVSALDTIVTITNGSDYEREALARYLHSLSPRSSRPFIKIDSSRYDPSDLNSLMFGEVNSNNNDKVAPLVICDGGTLFIDNIENTTAETQLKLLDIIETKKVRVHKQENPVPMDIRVVIGCSTNVQNNSSATNKVFSAKFINKIKHNLFNIPPLRERKEDIRILLDIALKEAARKHKTRQKQLNDKAIELLLQYKWPGNYDELRKLVNTFYANQKKEIITEKDIPSQIKLYNIPNEIMDDKSYLTEKIEKIEKLIITHTLIQNNNNIQKTAFTLGVDRSTLWRKIQKHNIKTIGLED